MRNQNTRPLLSFCLAGRNDDYIPDFRYRMTTMLNFLALSLEEAGRSRDVEVTIVDWGGITPLEDALDLSPAARRLASFIKIPQAKVCEIQGDNCFNAALAYNAAIRRSRGIFKAYSGADILIPTHSIENILSFLERSTPIAGFEPSSTFMLCGRYTIPYEVVDSRLTIEEWVAFLIKNNWALEKDCQFVPSFMRGGAGVVMMHEDLWEETSGIWEEMDGWGWSDIELGLRAAGVYQWLELSGFGVQIYDMGHKNDKSRMEMIRDGNPHIINARMQVNGSNWGLAGMDFFESKSDVASLDGECDTVLESKSDLQVVDIDKIEEQVASLLHTLLLDGAWGDLPDDILVEVCVIFLLVLLSENCDRELFLIDSGASYGYVAATVLASRKWADYIAIENWIGDVFPFGPQELSAMLASERVNYRGYARFLTDITLFEDAFTGVGSKRDGLVLLRSSCFASTEDAIKIFRNTLYGSESWSAVVFVYPQAEPFGSSKLYCEIADDFNVSVLDNFGITVVAYKDGVLIPDLDECSQRAVSMSEKLPFHIYKKVFNYLNSSEKRLLLYPCGSYLKRVLSISEKWLKESSLELVGIADDSADSEEMFMDLTLLKPEAYSRDSFDAILICSDTVSNTILRRCREVWGDALDIIEFANLVEKLKDA